MQLNSDQRNACAAMTEFLRSPTPFFLLSGFAGTGKTTTLRTLLEGSKARLIFTAPTNKATRVLRDSFNPPGTEEASKLSVECRTIYSLLGLRLEPSGELRELTHPEDPVDLRRYQAVIVDEASMVSAVLWKYIKKTADNQRIKFLFMGDPAQLPPVGEASSEVWSIEDRAHLSEVMRHGGGILEFVTTIRKQLNHPAPSLQLTSNNTDGCGVWKATPDSFRKKIKEEALAGNFSLAGGTRLIAWRNITVDAMNTKVRQHLFDQPGDFLPGDRILFIEPAKALDNPGTFACTDDEGTVLLRDEAFHPVYPDVPCYRLSVSLDTGQAKTLWVKHPRGEIAYSKHLAELAAAAKANGRKWGDYWAFREAFHSIRYGYALTAHRSQGSTYKKALVDVGDILRNRNRKEAFQCLYVACTRAQEQLYLLG